MEWIPDAYQMKGYDNSRSCAEIVKALQEFGGVTLHINCGAEGVLERAKSSLAEKGVDTADIRFVQFADPNFYVRDNGPTVMVDDRGGRILINPNWSYYGTLPPDDPYCVQSRIAAVQMGVSLGIFDVVNSDVVSEGGDREFNGQGVMMCIEDTEVRKRNPGLTKEQVEAEFKRLYNVEKIIWIPQPLLEDDDFRMGPLEYRDGVPYLGSSFAAHIDELCRFVDANTVVLAEVTDDEAAESAIGAENKRRIEAAYDVLSKATDVHGNPFAIKRMPVPISIDYVLTEDDENYGLYEGPVMEMGGAFADGTPMARPADRPFAFINWKARTNGTHRTIAASWLRETTTENFVWMSPSDAAERGLKNGDVVEVVGPEGTLSGHVRVTEGIRPGVVGANYSFGQQGYAARAVTIDGMLMGPAPDYLEEEGILDGDEPGKQKTGFAGGRGRGFCMNELLPEETLAGGGGVTDPIGGGAAQFDLWVDVRKA